MARPIKTMIKFHRKWLIDNGDSILESNREFLEQDIDEGTPEAFRQIPVSLDGLATYYGILGSVELIDGQESGWEHVSTAIDFRGWSLKLRAESFFRNAGTATNLTNHVTRAACLVCISEKWGRMAESVLNKIATDQDAVNQPYWNSRRFEPFVSECCLRRDGEKRSGDHLAPPYDAIIQSWNDERALARALELACDYHCANMDDVGGDWDPEFKHSPFDLLPCEVMLVRRIRSDLGLSTPDISHDLVSLLSPPDIISMNEEEHELLTRLSWAYDQSFA